MTNTTSDFRDLRVEKIESLKPRDRILKTAITLFNEHGVHTIGIDRIIAESGVSKRSFYNYFPSKSDLIAEYLDFWDGFRFDNLERHLAAAKGGAKAEILAIFDALEDWISQTDFNGCMFTRGLNDFSDEDTKQLREKVDAHFKKSTDFIGARLTELVKPAKAKTMLPQLLSLILGTMVVAHMTGDRKVAQLNKKIARTLLEE
ncbi:transcriptional regulator, TetR family [Chitinophaga sp. YR627]|uniref:TetR/AcrR family transcriptional regulator n=1 Tax=Chitinophaga sp. YR627 TaxID=1881041 RepID=UPI0008F0164F|nr:TetR/AcrR family transcriptional regulator [Chitinophaga sp. YR627]SFN18336.1 transcriptional regulator, TetR family [Chitinophaga sp. YR627]